MIERGLIEVHIEPELERPVEHVRLRKAEAHAPRQVPQACLHLQRFTQTEEVIGRIVNAHECAFQSADAAIQANAVLALFVYFQRKVDQAVFLVQLANRSVRIVGLQLVEVSQLVQAQQAQLPKTRAVNVSFLKGNLAPDDFVPRCSVALKFASPHVELFSFVDVDIKADEV